MARSRELTKGVGHLSRTKVKDRRGLHKGTKKSEAPAKEEKPHHVEKQVGGGNNGGSRLVPTSKASRFYPAEDVRKPKKSRKTLKPTKLRSTITPGTILILLAGRFRGKRVVFLKQLESGLLLVTGPFKVNGVPLRRINQAYAIATTTKVDLGEFKVRRIPSRMSATILTNRFRSTPNFPTHTSQRPSRQRQSRTKRSSSRAESQRRRSRSRRARAQIRGRSIRQ